MIVVLKEGAPLEDEQRLIETIEGWGLKTHVIHGDVQTVIGVIGDEALIRNRPLEVFPGVEQVMQVMKPYRLASREYREDDTLIELPSVAGNDPVTVGGREVIMLAGPCSIESRDSLFEIARTVRDGGAKILRAGAFKPRTSPYAFQGLGVEGLQYLAEVRDEVGLPIITEVLDTRDVELVAEKADILQIGARNMQNFNLLKAVGRTSKPVLIKRGMACTIEDLLMSAEYVLSQGNSRVLLCERGIRTFERMTRNTLDLSAVPVLKRESHLPVIIDPSHGTGHWDLIPSMARAAVAAGADGVVVELHFQPQHALSDGPQALKPDTFTRMMSSLRRVAQAVDREIAEHG